jgi:hypothetical protein
LISLGVYGTTPLFLRLFGGHDPKFRLILHLFHIRYGTILPCSVPGSGCDVCADHPLSMLRFPCRSYDADDPSVVTSLVPDSTIGGVCLIGSKNNERLTLNPPPGNRRYGPRRSWTHADRIRTQEECQRVHRCDILPVAAYLLSPPPRCTSLHARLNPYSYPGVTKVSNAVSLGGVDGILWVPAIVSPFITSHVPTSAFPQALDDAPEL